MDKESTECEPVPMDSEDELFIIYTSGTGGKPVGVVHTQAGYLLNAAITHKVCLALLQACKRVHFHMDLYTVCVWLPRRRCVCLCGCPGMDQWTYLCGVWAPLQWSNHCPV